MRLALSCFAFVAGFFMSALATSALAQPWDLFDGGKLLATGGVSQIEGAGGGGLANWAMITGYGTRDGLGANVHYTTVLLPDYTLRSAGVAVGLYDRLELSYAWQEFDTQDVGAALGLGRGFTFHQNIFGAKLKLIGDAVYEQDSWLPQLSVGLQHKENDRGAVIGAVGGKSDQGTDYYLSASKLFLAQSLLVNATWRHTRANQFGILGLAATGMPAIAPSSKARPPICSAGALRWGRSCAPSPTIFPSPRNRRPGTYSPPISSTRTSRRRSPMPISATS